MVRIKVDFEIPKNIGRVTGVMIQDELGGLTPVPFSVHAEVHAEGPTARVLSHIPGPKTDLA